MSVTSEDDCLLTESGMLADELGDDADEDCLITDLGILADELGDDAEEDCLLTESGILAEELGDDAYSDMEEDISDGENCDDKEAGENCDDKEVVTDTRGPCGLPFISKYERVALLIKRVEQIERGALPMISLLDHLTPREQALAELKSGLLPLMLERNSPHGGRELVRPVDLTYVEF